MGYTAPHDPLQADPEFMAKCAGIPNRHRRAFCGMMAQLDAGVGNVTQVGSMFFLHRVVVGLGFWGILLVVGFAVVVGVERMCVHRR